MRLSIVLLAVTVLLVASMASAGRLEETSIRIPEQVILNPPEGAYWDEDLGVFVFDPPIPITMPQSMILGEGADTIYFDGDTMYFAVPELLTHFTVTRMPTPDCGPEGWRLTAVLLGCYNDLDTRPDTGNVVVYAHHVGEACINPWMNPEGDSLGDVLGSQGFRGLDYGEHWDPGDPARAVWTQVDFATPIVITEPEFWVAWDYTPLFFRNSYHISGNFRAGYKPEDYEIFFEWWGSPCPQLYIYGPWLVRAVGSCVGGGPKIDIKPQSCPNPVNVRSQGVLPVAILGAADLDVEEIDPATALLEGVSPIRWAFNDVAEPFPGELCDCWTEGPDGFRDLTFKFDVQEVVQALGVFKDRDTLELTLTWQMFDGSAMQGSDCIIIIDQATKTKGGKDGRQMLATRPPMADVFALSQNSPNPFRSGTTICFSLPNESHATLTVHDLTGRTLATLVDEELAAGMHTAEWSADVPSGVYFYRIEAGGMTAGRRMVLIR